MPEPKILISSVSKVSTVVAPDKKLNEASTSTTATATTTRRGQVKVLPHFNYYSNLLSNLNPVLSLSLFFPLWMYVIQLAAPSTTTTGTPPSANETAGSKKRAARNAAANAELQATLYTCDVISAYILTYIHTYIHMYRFITYVYVCMQVAAEQEAFILAHNLEVTVNESMGKIGYFDLKSRFVLYVCM